MGKNATYRSTRLKATHKNKRKPSFPRSAWECRLGRSSVPSVFNHAVRDAERRTRHSHAERGNEIVALSEKSQSKPDEATIVLKLPAFFSLDFFGPGTSSFCGSLSV